MAKKKKGREEPLDAIQAILDAAAEQASAEEFMDLLLSLQQDVDERITTLEEEAEEAKEEDEDEENDEDDDPTE